MAHAGNISEWIALFAALYAIGAGLAELRSPGFWEAMIGDWERSRALQFLTGFACIVIGAAIYLANPWLPDDWLAVTVTVLGGWIVVEGLLIMVAGDVMMRVSRLFMGRAARAWAWIALVIGLMLAAIAINRL